MQVSQKHAAAPTRAVRARVVLSWCLNVPQSMHSERGRSGVVRVELQPGFFYSMLLGNRCHGVQSECHRPPSSARLRIAKPTAPLRTHRSQIWCAWRHEDPPSPCENSVKNEDKSSWNMLMLSAVMTSPSWALLLYFYEVKRCLCGRVCCLIG